LANFGARPLKRAIQKYLEDPMAEVMIKASLTEGDYVNVGFNEAKQEIRIKIHKKKALPEISQDSNATS
jgi:ATP-dependent Clp protease ATP-binding subunit ClpC